MGRAVSKVILSAAVATGGTFTVGYPDGYNGGHFAGGIRHVMTSSYGTMYAPTTFTVAFANALATVTYNGATTLAKGTEVWVEFDTIGRSRDDLVNFSPAEFLYPAPLYWINLGSPIAADVDGIATTQTFGGAGDFTLNGATVTGGIGYADVPRNVTATVATSNHSARTITVTGKDQFGNVVVESFSGPNNNTVSGKKAFAEVTNVAISGAAATNGISIGWGDVLGLPVHLPSAACVIAEFEDMAAPSAGTKVAGLNAATKSTATTGDVRGTYDPNSACDGSKAFALLVALPHPDWLGNDQYAG